MEMINEMCNSVMLPMLFVTLINRLFAEGINCSLEWTTIESICHKANPNPIPTLSGRSAGGKKWWIQEAYERDDGEDVKGELEVFGCIRGYNSPWEHVDLHEYYDHEDGYDTDEVFIADADDVEMIVNRIKNISNPRSPESRLDKFLSRLAELDGNDELSSLPYDLRYELKRI